MKIDLRNINADMWPDFWAATLKKKSKIIDLAINRFRFRFILSIVSAVCAVSLFGMTSAIAGGIIFNSDFESGGIKGWGRNDGRLPGAITVQSSVKRAGKYGVKLHIKKCSWISPLCSPKPVALRLPRSQLGNGGRLKLPLDKSMWIGYSIFFPSDFASPTGEMVAGVTAHNRSGGPGDCQQGAAQPFSFRLRSNQYYMRSTTESTPKKWRQFDLATIKKGQWLDVAMNWKWSYGNDGFFKIWVNGKQKVAFKGSTLCRATRRLNNGGGLPFLNATNYYANWNKEPNKAIKSLTLYLDEIRVGNSLASFKDVVPRGAAKAGGTASAAPATKSTTTTAANRQPVATKGRRRLYRTCNKYKGKKRDACARQVRAYNRSLGYAG